MIEEDYASRCRIAQDALDVAKNRYAEWSNIPWNKAIFKRVDKLGRHHLILYDSEIDKFSVVKKAALAEVGISIESLPDWHEFQKSIRPIKEELARIKRSFREKSVDIVKSFVDSKLFPYYKERREAYDEYLASEEWSRKRRECLSIHGHLCIDCGANYSDIHHRHYETLGFENPETDIVPLCRYCHQVRHATGEL